MIIDYKYGDMFLHKFDISSFDFNCLACHQPLELKYKNVVNCGNENCRSQFWLQETNGSLLIAWYPPIVDIRFLTKARELACQLYREELN